MKNKLRHTLVSEGATDANLIPIINWALKQSAGIQLPTGMRAEFWRLPQKPEGMVEKILKAVEFYPCDVLFIHRDSDTKAPQIRHDEIRVAFAKAKVEMPVIAVVPVRMLEAWLCFSEIAVRQAAGNPKGTVKLNLPSLKRVESRPDPKTDLKNALLSASEQTGRRRNKFDTSAAFWRLVDCIDDFSPLRTLSSFQSFEKSLAALKENGWKAGFYGLGK
jgi:hypothetical protein